MTESANADDRYRVDIDPDGENNAHSYMLQLVGHDRRVLEIGCAGGHLTEYFTRRGNSVVGVEIDPDAADLARQWAQRVHVADLDVTALSDLPGLKGERFDVIVAGDVLEHLRDPKRALADAVELLKPGGRVVISVPHVGHIDIRLMLLGGAWVYQDTGLLDQTHLRWFTRSNLRELLADVGLRAVDHREVRIGRFGTSLPVDPSRVPQAIIRYIEVDSDAHLFQMVVAAQRASETDAPDALEAPEPGWLDLDGEIRALRDELDSERAHSQRLEEAIDALQARVEAVEGSAAHRVLAPLRKLRANLSGHHATKRS